KSPLGRMHALYALDGLAALEKDTLIDNLEEHDPNVRRHAIRLAERFPDSHEVSSALSRLADRDDNLEARYQLAFTRGNSKGAAQRAASTKDLLKIIRHDVADRWIQAA